MFQSVFVVKVLYVFKYWLTTVFGWWSFLWLQYEFAKLAFYLYFVHGPAHFFVFKLCRSTPMIWKAVGYTEIYQIFSSTTQM